MVVEPAVAAPPNLKPAPDRRPLPNPTRRPLLPPEAENGNVAAQRRPRSREVKSRYLTTSSSSSNSASSSSTLSNSSYLSHRSRCPSPIAHRSAAEPAAAATPVERSSVMKRAQSVERKRPATAKPNRSSVGPELSTAAAKQLLSSRRSLSMSLQVEPLAATKPSPSPGLRKPTPERRRASTPVARTPTPRKETDREVNAKRVEQQHNPVLSGKMNPSPSPSLRKPTPERRRPSSPVARTQRMEEFRGENDKPLEQQQPPPPPPPLPSSKTKPSPLPSPSPNLRKATPERRPSSPVPRTAKKELHHEQAVRSRQVNPSVIPLSRSVDLGSERKKFMGGFAKVVRVLQKSLNGGVSRSSSSGKEEFNTGKELLSDSGGSRGVNSLNRSVSAADSTAYDAESVCSSCNSGSKDYERVTQGQGGLGGGDNHDAAVPARFMQDTDARLRCTPEAGSPLFRSNSLRTTASTKMVSPKKLLGTGPSPKEAILSRGLSPLRGCARPSSPSRPSTPVQFGKPSPSRGIGSPSRVRNAVAAVCGKASVSSFTADVRRVGKVGENSTCDAHLLKLLYNRQLQWRFVNARAEGALFIQKLNTEMNLFSTWKAISDLSGIVLNKKLELVRLRLKLKLTLILNSEMSYLEEWATIEKDHSSSLLGAIESLKANTLQLPVVCGARVDVQNVKNAICSAVDVLQAMASSICSLLLKVEEVNPLVAEVASITSSKCALLNECRDILSTIAAMQVKDFSLRTHILQQKRGPSSLLCDA